MSVSSFIYTQLKDIASTYPISVPLEVDVPYITYSLDGSEDTKSLNSGGVRQHFVSVIVWGKEYDATRAMAEEVKEQLRCSDRELNIMGVSFVSQGVSYDGQPLDIHSVTLELNIYERF